MTKITLLGAGSGFTQPLFTDILNIEGLDEGIIGLVDIDAKRLGVNVRLMKRIIDLMGRKKWRIEASTDRKKILKGTDYLINTIEVSGMECVKSDNDIPLRYGIDQCVADTIGPGGVMKALRTMPFVIDILKDAGKLCPGAMILNYTNPMSIITLGAIRSTRQTVLGLCHSVQANSRGLAYALGVPFEQLEWRCGGINHMAWFTELKWRGKDLAPKLREHMEKPDVMETCPIRSDVFKNLGYFVTEDCAHLSEYLPYYRKRRDLLEKHCPGLQTAQRSKTWPDQRRRIDRIREEMADGRRDIPLKRSHEYAADIIEAHVFGRKKVVHASVLNTNLIPNLPLTGVVEVPVLVDINGCMPLYFGELPEQCAALCRSNMAVFELGVQGILKCDREAVIHAMMLDPLSAAVCSPGEIRSMAEELFKAQKKYLPKWIQSKKAGPAPVPRALTGFVNVALVSRLCPHADIKKLPYPRKLKTPVLKRRVFDGNFCSVRRELLDAGQALVYFLYKIECPENMKLNMLFGYDGPVKVWLDGWEIFCDPNGTNPAKADSAKIPIMAGKGKHAILVALDSNQGNAYGIWCRFERMDVPKKLLAKGPDGYKMPKVETESMFEKGIRDVSSMAAMVIERNRK